MNFIMNSLMTCQIWNSICSYKHLTFNALMKPSSTLRAWQKKSMFSISHPWLSTIQLTVKVSKWVYIAKILLTFCWIAIVTKLTLFTELAVCWVLTFVTNSDTVLTGAVEVASAICAAILTCPPQITDTLVVRCSRTCSVHTVVVTSNKQEKKH